MVVEASNGSLSLTGFAQKGSLNPFSPSIALTAGVISSVGLISGAICDQEFWQRCFSIRENHLRKSFVFGAALFATIPIGLSLLGFVAAHPANGLTLPSNFDNSLVGFAVVAHLLPHFCAVLYLYMILAGLCSTLDSALSAVSSLYPLLRQAPWRVRSGERRSLTIGQARISMLILGAVGLFLSYAIEFIPGFGLKYLWFFLNTAGACIVVPTVLSLFSETVTAKGILLRPVTVSCPLL